MEYFSKGQEIVLIPYRELPAVSVDRLENAIAHTEYRYNFIPINYTNPNQTFEIT